MHKTTVIIFVKLPQAGRSKTRLGRSIGMSRAANLFRVMTQKVIHTCLAARSRNPEIDIVLAIDPAHALGARLPCWVGVTARIAQSKGDLGERMVKAMQDVRRRGVQSSKRYDEDIRPHIEPSRGPVIIIGSDAAQMRIDHITDAVNALKSHDAVFGPAHDGGYWLTGFSNLDQAPALFQGVRWSSETTLEDSIRSLPKHFRINYLETLRDIDELEDLQAIGLKSLMRW